MPLEYEMPHGDWGNDAADWRGTDAEYRAKIDEATREAANNGRTQKPDASQGKDPFSWAGGFELTEDQAGLIADPEWAYRNLVIAGHYMVLCAAPNHGKTTIMLHVSADLAKSGYRVIYINADVSGVDAKPMFYYAKEHGFQMLFPDMIAGQGIADVMSHLEAMADSEDDLSGNVLVIDTLKKVASLMDKRGQTGLYKLFRRLTARGLTLVVCAHTNKYTDADGKPMFEGTGDVRSDCDDLVYLVAAKDEVTGELTVSTIPDKMRGAFEKITFHIDRERNVTRLDEYVDVVSQHELARKHDEDLDRIAMIEAVLKDGPKNQSEIVGALSASMNRKAVRRILREYSQGPNQHWSADRAFRNNEFRYWIEGTGDNRCG